MKTSLTLMIMIREFREKRPGTELVRILWNLAYRRIIMIMIMSLITMIMIMIREFCDDDDINIQ